MKSCHPSDGMPNPAAVYALSWAIWTLSSAAPSMRLNAFNTPDSSHTAMTIGTPISPAFASAAAISRCARSLVTLAFSNTSVTARSFRQMGSLPLPAIAQRRRSGAVLPVRSRASRCQRSVARAAAGETRSRFWMKPCTMPGSQR